MDKRKVIHIFNSINYSGAEIMYEAAAPIFINNNFKLYAISTGNKLGDFVNDFIHAGFIVFHLPYQRIRNIKYYIYFFPYFYRVYKLFKQHSFDVLHIHRRHLFWMYAFMGKLAGIPVLIRTVHNVFRPRFYRYPEYFLSRHFTKLILKVKITSISESVYNHEFKWFLNKTIKINNWYNPAEFYPSNYSEKEKLRSKFSIPKEKIVFISVGACINQKRHEDIIKALNLLNKKNGNWIYLHLGDGILNEDEKRLTDELGLQDKIYFLGNKKNVRNYLIMSDVFIMTSDYEGLGIAAVEAMACSLPVILYDVPGLRDLVPPGSENGVLVKKDYTELAKSIKYFIKNYDVAGKFAANGYNLVKEYYNMEVSINKYISLYNS